MQSTELLQSYAILQHDDEAGRVTGHDILKVDVNWILIHRPSDILSVEFGISLIQF